jgi:hypothetical protein
MEAAAAYPPLTRSGTPIDHSPVTPSIANPSNPDGPAANPSQPVSIRRSPSNLTDKEPRADFVFSVRDGRLGSITISDHGATKRAIAAPLWSIQYVDQLVVTAMAATASLVFIGDASGVLYQWDTDSGETMVVPTARKPIRLMLMASPAPQALCPDPLRDAALGRLLLLYGDSTYSVWEVNKALNITQGIAVAHRGSPLGLISDAAWLPLPSPLLRGSITLFLQEHGALVLVNAAQARGAPLGTQARMHALRRLLSNASVPMRTRGAALKDPGDEEDRGKGGGVKMSAALRCESLLCLPPSRLSLVRLVVQVRPAACLCSLLHVRAGGGCSTLSGDALHSPTGG